MPYYKKRTKRNPFYYKKKRGNRKRKTSIPKTLSTGSVFNIKRSFIQVADLNPGALTPGWATNIGQTLIYKNWVFTLSDLVDYTDMTNMFKYYKITGVKTQIYFSNTGSNTEDASQFSNSQLMVWYDINQNGAPMTGSEDEFVVSQTSGKKLCLATNGRPITFYHKTKQIGYTYSTISQGNVDYNLQRPKWMATTEPATPHYGLKMLMTRVDGQAFTSGFSNFQRMKVINTYYISLKKVQ